MLATAYMAIPSPAAALLLAATSLADTIVTAVVTALVGAVIAVPSYVLRQRRKKRDALEKLEAWRIDVKRASDELARATATELTIKPEQLQLLELTGFAASDLSGILVSLDDELRDYALECDSALRAVRWQVVHRRMDPHEIVVGRARLGRSIGMLKEALDLTKRGKPVPPLFEILRLDALGSGPGEPWG